MITTTTTWTNNNPNTIWNKLAAKLGHEPTPAEAAAEIKRLLREAAEREKGKIMITPTHDDIGRRVIYRRNGTTDIGTITSVSEHYVFVRYGADQTSKATLSADLDWTSDSEQRSKQP